MAGEDDAVVGSRETTRDVPEEDVAPEDHHLQELPPAPILPAGIHDAQWQSPIRDMMHVGAPRPSTHRETARGGTTEDSDAIEGGGIGVHGPSLRSHARAQLHAAEGEDELEIRLPDTTNKRFGDVLHPVAKTLAWDVVTQSFHWLFCHYCGANANKQDNFFNGSQGLWGHVRGAHAKEFLEHMEKEVDTIENAVDEFILPHCALELSGEDVLNILQDPESHKTAYDPVGYRKWVEDGCPKSEDVEAGSEDESEQDAGGQDEISAAEEASPPRKWSLGRAARKTARPTAQWQHLSETSGESTISAEEASHQRIMTTQGRAAQKTTGPSELQGILQRSSTEPETSTESNLAQGRAYDPEAVLSDNHGETAVDVDGCDVPEKDEPGAQIHADAHDRPFKGIDSGTPSHGQSVNGLLPEEDVGSEDQRHFIQAAQAGLHNNAPLVKQEPQRPSSRKQAVNAVQEPHTKDSRILTNVPFNRGSTTTLEKVQNSLVEADVLKREVRRTQHENVKRVAPFGQERDSKNASGEGAMVANGSLGDVDPEPQYSYGEATTSDYLRPAAVGSYKAGPEPIWMPFWHTHLETVPYCSVYDGKSYELVRLSVCSVVTSHNGKTFWLLLCPKCGRNAGGDGKHMPNIKAMLQHIEHAHAEMWNEWKQTRVDARKKCLKVQLTRAQVQGIAAGRLEVAKLSEKMQGRGRRNGAKRKGGAMDSDIHMSEAAKRAKIF